MKIMLVETTKDGLFLQDVRYITFESIIYNEDEVKMPNFKLIKHDAWSKNCMNYAKFCYKLDASLNSDGKIDCLNFYKDNKLKLAISNKDGKYLFKTYNKEGIAEFFKEDSSSALITNMLPYIDIIKICIDSKYFSLY